MNEQPCCGLLQVQQLYNDLYEHLMDELKAAMAGLAVAQQQPQQQQAKQQSSSQVDPACSNNTGSRKDLLDSSEKLLQLAAECEAAGDVPRSHALHQRRLLLLQSADVSVLELCMMCFSVPCC